jgi:hypothetical protein
VRVAAHGIAVDLPDGWEGRIFRRSHGDPTLHAGTFALPFEDGEFGSRATARIPPGGTFVTLTEYRPGQGLEPGKGLFAPTALPLPLEPGHFRPRTLQVGRAGQAGVQHFFTAGGRPFCMYAVVRPATRGRGAVAAGPGQVAAINDVLGTVRFD